MTSYRSYEITKMLLWVGFLCVNVVQIGQLKKVVMRNKFLIWNGLFLTFVMISWHDMLHAFRGLRVSISRAPVESRHHDVMTCRHCLPGSRSISIMAVEHLTLPYFTFTCSPCDTVSPSSLVSLRRAWQCLPPVNGSRCSNMRAWMREWVRAGV